jgi:hypothetical protein
VQALGWIEEPWRYRRGHYAAGPCVSRGMVPDLQRTISTIRRSCSGSHLAVNLAYTIAAGFTGRERASHKRKAAHGGPGTPASP